MDGAVFALVIGVPTCIWAFDVLVKSAARISLDTVASDLCLLGFSTATTNIITRPLGNDVRVAAFRAAAIAVPLLTYIVCVNVQSPNDPRYSPMPLIRWMRLSPTRTYWLTAMGFISLFLEAYVLAL